MISGPTRFEVNMLVGIALTALISLPFAIWKIIELVF